MLAGHLNGQHPLFEAEGHRRFARITLCLLVSQFVGSFAPSSRSRPKINQISVNIGHVFCPLSLICYKSKQANFIRMTQKIPAAEHSVRPSPDNIDQLLTRVFSVKWIARRRRWHRVPDSFFFDDRIVHVLSMVVELR
jgi:hypothetical protein